MGQLDTFILKAFRNNQRLSRKTLAERAQMNVKRLRDLERGNIRATASDMIALSSALQVQANDLIK
jgi:transcriptional regulator with XRE-family HTH domain